MEPSTAATVPRAFSCRSVAVPDPSGNSHIAGTVLEISPIATAEGKSTHQVWNIDSEMWQMTGTPSIWCTRALAMAAAALACVATSSRADPSDFVFQPYAEAGTRVVQYTGGVDKNRDVSSDQSHSLALATSPSSRWFTAGYIGWSRQPGGAFGYSEISWINHLQVITGESSPAAVGMYLEVERPRDRSAGYGITWGPTFQFDTAHAQVIMNTWIEKFVRDTPAGPAVLNYQWQVKSLFRPHLEFGMQGFGSMGAWNHWDSANAQEHSLGPAVFVSWPMQDRHAVRFDSAVLAGLTSASPRLTLRLRMQYEF